MGLIAPVQIGHNADRTRIISNRRQRCCLVSSPIVNLVERLIFHSLNKSRLRDDQGAGITGDGERSLRLKLGLRVDQGEEIRVG